MSNVSSVSQSSKSSGVGTWSSSGAVDGEQDYIAVNILPFEDRHLYIYVEIFCFVS